MPLDRSGRNFRHRSYLASVLCFLFFLTTTNPFHLTPPIVSSPFGLNTVSSHSFGLIERLIRRSHHGLRRWLQKAPPGNADAHSHPDLFLSIRGPGSLWGIVKRTILPSDSKLVSFYGLAKSFQEGKHRVDLPGRA